MFYRLFIYLFIYLVFLGFHSWHVEVPRVGAQIGAVAASLHHSHSNARSELHLWHTPQLMAMPDPWTHWMMPGNKPMSSCSLPMSQDRNAYFLSLSKLKKRNLWIYIKWSIYKHLYQIPLMIKDYSRNIETFLSFFHTHTHTHTHTPHREDDLIPFFCLQLLSQVLAHSKYCII